jgi:hypothetical protein
LPNKLPEAPQDFTSTHLLGTPSKYGKIVFWGLLLLKSFINENIKEVKMTESLPLCLGTEGLLAQYSAMDDTQIQKKHVVSICSENNFDIDGAPSPGDLTSLHKFL